MIPQIRTLRLLLREWRREDREPFARIAADPQAMRYYPALLTRAESDERLDAYEREWARAGFGRWAVEIRGAAGFAGSLGFSEARFPASFTPCVEIGWRLDRRYWGQGYATEAARAALEFGFRQLALKQIAAFTVPANSRSLRVMEKLEMQYWGEFAHPGFADGDPFRRHRLYRKTGL